MRIIRVESVFKGLRLDEITKRGSVDGKEKIAIPKMRRTSKKIGMNNQ